MAVGPAVGLEVLERGPRRAETSIEQAERSERRFGLERVAKSDVPAVAKPAGRGSQGIKAGPPAVDKGRGRPPVIADHGDSAVDRVPFANASQIDEDPGSIEDHRPLFG